MEHVIMDSEGMRRTFVRLAHEIAERDPAEEIVLVGIKRGGEYVANRMRAFLAEAAGVDTPCGSVDIGMQRDDLVSAFFCPNTPRTGWIFRRRKDGGALRRRPAYGPDGARGHRDGVPAGQTQSNPVAGTYRPRRQRTACPRRFCGKKRADRPRRICEVYFTERGSAEDKIVVGKEKSND